VYYSIFGLEILKGCVRFLVAARVRALLASHLDARDGRRWTTTTVEDDGGAR